MSSDAVKQLRRLAREAELQLVEKSNGHFILIGGLVTVHFWPESKRMTAWVDGSPSGRHYTTPKQVVNLATKGSV